MLVNTRLLHQKSVCRKLEGATNGRPTNTLGANQLVVEDGHHQMLIFLLNKSNWQQYSMVTSSLYLTWTEIKSYYRSQFNCNAAMQGAHHILHLI